jgi:hypothetical protein
VTGYEPWTAAAPPDGAPACTCTSPDCPDPVHQSPHLTEPDLEAEAEAEAEWADEWDSADSNAYQDRVAAGLEPEAEPW